MEDVSVRLSVPVSMKIVDNISTHTLILTDEKTKRMKDEILVVLKLKFFVTVNEGSNKLLLR
jgi:hypothetical protein